MVKGKLDKNAFEMKFFWNKIYHNNPVCLPPQDDCHFHPWMGGGSRFNYALQQALKRGLV